MKTTSLAKIHANRLKRPTGYLEACIAAAISNDGITLTFTDEAWSILRGRYAVWCPLCKVHTHDLTGCPGRGGKSVAEIQAELRDPDCCDPPRLTPG